MKGGSTALLHFCISLPRAASAGAARRRLGSSAADQGPEGGPRSAPERSPRALRERVPPDLRLATPPRIHAGRATASGHRAVPKHEAKLCEELERDCGRSGESERGERELSVWFGTHQQHAHPVRHGRREMRVLAVAGMRVDIAPMPMVEANGNKPISPLSVAAEPHCVSVKELQLGRRTFKVPPEVSLCSANGQVLACGRLRGASIHRAK